MTRVGVTFDGRGEVMKFVLTPVDDPALAGWRAMMLAPTLEICRALLRGESVPVSLLRPEWITRFGRKPR